MHKTLTRWGLPLLWTAWLLVGCNAANWGLTAPLTPASAAAADSSSRPAAASALEVVSYREDYGGFRPVETGLTLTLRPQRGSADPETPSAPTAVTRLAENEARALLTRVPSLAPEPVASGLFLPPRQLTPPAGDTQAAAFPPPAAAPEPEVADSDLRVLRFSPSQDAALAPGVSVTFSKPMAPLTSHGQLDSRERPVVLEPAVEGAWQWVGTRTLVFRPAAGLPGATQYQARVPAGVKAMDGTALAEAFAWDFRTTPLALVRTYPPRAPQALTPYVALEFDQAVDAAALWPFLRLEAGGKALEAVPVPQERSDLPAALARFLASARPERTVVLQPAQRLPADATLTVTVEAGAPSAEGPLVTTEPQRMSLRTYGPLQITEQSCPVRGAAWQEPCYPGEAFRIYLNHEVDVASLSPAQVTIQPALPGGRITVFPWGMLSIAGQSAPNEIYALEIAPGLTDVFGQTFDAPQTVQFQVREQEPWLWSPNAMEVLPPARQGQYEIYSRNLNRVRLVIYRVEPGQWAEYLDILNRLYDDAPPNMARLFDGNPLADEWIALDASATAMTRTVIDLNPYLEDGVGQLALFLAPPRPLWQRLWRNDVPYYGAWVQATALGVDAYGDAARLVLQASALASGQPLENVTLLLQPEGVAVTTDVEGQAVVEKTALQGMRRAPEAPAWIEARQGRDVAFLPGGDYGYYDYRRAGETPWGWGPTSFDRDLWHVLTDRHLYQPGETVHVKGWLRRWQAAPEGDVVWARPAATRIAFTVEDGRGIELAAGHARLDDRDAFDFVFDIPDGANSGQASLRLALPHRTEDRGADPHYALFQIEAFRRPEFELTLSRSDAAAVLDDPVPLTATARYYGGGSLAEAAVLWEVSGQPAQYVPPGWNDFEFGASPFSPWLRTGGHARAYDRFEADTRAPESLEGVLDARGRHGIDVTASASLLPLPHFLQATATVRDVSQQTRSASQDILVHPARHYVGIKTDGYLIPAQEPYPLTLIVTDVEGAPVPGQEITVKATRRRDPDAREAPLAEPVPEQAQCRLLSASEAVTCRLRLAAQGLWDIEAATTDAAGRPNVTLIERWVVGSSAALPEPRTASDLEIVPDKSEYQPGDVAEVLIMPPFLPAYGTAIVSRGGILHYESLAITQPQHVLRVPLAEAYVPNAYVSVFLSGRAEQESARAAGPRTVWTQAELPLSTATRALTVDLALQTAALAPGGEAKLTIRVTDRAGAPVPGAEVALLAVDEAILALAGYRHGHPIDTFYPLRYPDLAPYHLREYIVPERRAADDGGFGFGGGAEEMDAAAYADGPISDPGYRAAAAPMAATALMAEASGRDEAAPASRAFVRQDFDPLSAFEPSGVTDAHGTYVMTWTLPDAIGQYRVVAVAAAGPQRFGLGETAFATRLPIQLRPQWPRFLHYGDSAQLPVIVENQTDQAQELFLLLQSDGLELAFQTGDLSFDGVSLALPARSRQGVTLPARARRAGEIRLLASAFSAQARDDVLNRMPVYVPAAQESFAAYGAVEETAAIQGFVLPSAIHPAFGALTITASSTLLQSLTDSYLELTASPWPYPEALASRILAQLALRDVLPVFGLEHAPAEADMQAAIQADVDALQAFQNPDGGFPLWRRNGESWPYVSVHALHALARARSAGFSGIEPRYDYLKAIDRHIPADYPENWRHLIGAYALFTRAGTGDIDPAAAWQLLERAPWSEHALETLAWCLLVLGQSPTGQNHVSELWDYLLNRVEETARGAVFVQAYREEDDYLVLSSDRRSDALLLQALMDTRPTSDLIPKLVAGLMAARRAGHWGNAQDNVFVLLAMNQYFRAYEALEPDFRARVWADETLVMDEGFQGRALASRQQTLPMSWLASAQPERLHIQRVGQGRMYYRLGLDYVPDTLELEPLEKGFTVLRRYSGADDPDDVRQDADGTWRIRLGARVRIDVTLVAPARRHHVLLASPVPAGLELVNPALQGTRPDGRGRVADGPYGFWFNHQQLLDDQTQVLTTYLPAGVYEYGAVAEATMAGAFQAPPAHAQEIYAPETFGRSGSDRVLIEEFAGTRAGDAENAG